ncbi:phosphate ABC transporter substrate-binding protein PstS [Streptomyces albus]|uniref:Phosphate-binding protein n=1 Tax=Streptomyces albus TaxID=1888 RepID=A0A8H1LNB7_9ACTN|nr:phosphate ABC transporter substrate-binding protein PstS [Streptomyces albus]TGG88139.1 phosphate ABC transporter substrate-binding protein PstS [Streptomyces albus]UVN56042.1 phosphate ABC transporter substrate-binding protein PstS [Streptomyces albus]
MKLQRTIRLRTAAVGALVVSGALVLSACGSDDNSGGSGSETSKAASNIKCDGEGKLLASGSSAQKNAMDVWTQTYQSACSGTQLNYKPTGSGAGIQEFLQGKTAFAGSDSALKPDEVAKSKKVCKSGQAIDLPMVGGPVAVAYKLDGVDDLVLDADTLAKIFDSKITKWNDPAIKKLNPDADLPGTKIQAFHRSDESGTTDNFTKYLNTAAPSFWKHEPAKAWAGKGGQGADGSSGIATNVKQNDGAIGYVELSYATGNDLSTVKLDTGAKEPVEATTDNASKAIADAKVVGQGKDLSLELNYKTKAEDAYPIVLVTYEIVCDKGNKKESLDATKSFLKYTASEDGQKSLAEKGYAPIPDEIITKVRSTVDSLK